MKVHTVNNLWDVLLLSIKNMFDAQSSEQAQFPLNQVLITLFIDTSLHQLSVSPQKGLSEHRRTKQQDWKSEPEVHINSLYIGYVVVRSYSFCNQGKVLMSGYHDGFAYKSPYIVSLFRYTHRIPSGNNTTTSDLRQHETRTSDARTSRSITPKREHCGRTNLEAKDLSLQRVFSKSNGMDAKCYLWCIA